MVGVDIKDMVLQDIVSIIKRFNVEKVILFGSRARGDHSSRSDYDIAIYGETLTSVDKACISSEMEEIDTLLQIDIVFIDANENEDLLVNIERDGVTIFE